MLRLSPLACVLSLVVGSPALADNAAPVRSVSANQAAGSAALTIDGNPATGWKSTGEATITFEFGGEQYLTGLVLVVSGGGADVTFVTDAGVRRDERLLVSTYRLPLVSIFTKSLTLELRNIAPGFSLNEVSFTQGPPPAPARPKMTATASSVLDKKPAKYGPQLAIDGDLATAWNEGVTTEPKGEWLDITFDKPAFVQHVGFVVGYSKYNEKVGEVWFKNNRIKTARVEYGNGWYYTAAFEDRFDFQYVPARMIVGKARLTIGEIYPGLKWDDTPISEVKVIYEYIDDVKLEASFDQDATMKASKEPRYLVVRVKGAYTFEGERAPGNVALVIDQSGSMSDQDRLLHARESAKLFVSSLGPRDYISLISFDDNVYTRHEPALATPEVKADIVKAIDTLLPQGGTDIFSALSKAVELVDKNRSPEYANRVVLVSDGQPTSGNTNTAAITGVAEGAYTSKGIITSTFGVGADYAEALMAGAAKASNGSFYHITTPAQMFKVFGQEMASIMKVLGRSPILTVALPSNLTVGEVYGYPFKQTGSALRIELRPISAADEQKVVVQLSPKATYPAESEVTVTLEYQDALHANRAVTLSASRVLAGTDDDKEAKASVNTVATAEVISSRGAGELDAAATQYASGAEGEARQALKDHIAKLKTENAYLKSEALTNEIAVLEGIAKQMEGASASSTNGRLAIKEAKATAMAAMSRSYADTSLNAETSTDPAVELRRLLASDFSDTSAYGAVESSAIVGMLVGRGLAKPDAAKGCNTMGYRAYSRKDWDKAISWFDTALGYDATHVLALYNAACTWGLKGNAQKAVEYLTRLTKLSDPAAKKRLVKAQKDTDLDAVRDDPAFKAFMAKL